MNSKKPAPLMTVAIPRRCPVCGKASYSPAGEHPQCSLARADAVRRAALKATGAVVASQPRFRQWSKRCPRCGHQIPARQVVCDCAKTADGGKAAS
jgi:ribosomal protein S27AE